MATINDSDKTKNNTVVIILIFFLIFLIISSIIILSRFSISSKRASTSYEKSNDIKISKIEDVEKEEQEKKEAPVVQATQETSKTTEAKQQTQTTTKPQTQLQTQTQTQTTQVVPKVQPQTKQKPIVSQKETKPANYVINAKNIKKYHNILLREFEGVKTVEYKVKWGDTLWKIALKYNTSAHTIYVLNAFNDPDLIICGTIIKVPVNFVLSKTKTNSILLELINKEKSSYENKYLNKNLYTFNFVNIDYIYDDNYIFEEKRII